MLITLDNDVSMTYKPLGQAKKWWNIVISFYRNLMQKQTIFGPKNKIYAIEQCTMLITLDNDVSMTYKPLGQA